ncbi:MAG: hypothetical protein WCK89_00130 [bacterium]
MKLALFFPLILLLGLIVGGWAPKEELRAAKKEAAELKEKLASREKDSRMDTFTRMVQIPGRATKTSPATKRKTASVNVTPADEPGSNAWASAAAPAATNAPEVKAAPPEPENPKLSPEDLHARIEEAKELWKTRSEIARAQWIDRLKLTPEATALFDTSVNAMNEELYTAMQGLADKLAAGETLTPETGTRAFNEMTSALVKTYDDLTVLVPEAQRGEAAKLELTDFIDPAVAEPLIAVQDKLENLPGQRRPMGFQRNE